MVSLALYLFVSIWFQVLFHSPPGVLFTFPSRYFFSIGWLVVFSLWGWSPFLRAEFLVLYLTLDATCLVCISSTWLLLSLVKFSNLFDYVFQYFMVVRTPDEFLLLVWAVTISLAATLVIDVSFFSYWYLDVSVPSVPFHNLFIQLWIPNISIRWVSSFGYLWL